jgi:hypothetical protein
MWKSNSQIVSWRLLWLPVALAVTIPDPAYAGSQAAGNITTMATNPPVGGYPAVFFFATNGTRSSPPSCATIGGRWAIDGSTMGGQQSIALVMSAQAQGRQIIVQGNGTCSVWGDTETASYIEVIL